MLIEFKELFPRYNFNPKVIVHCGASSAQERDKYNELGVEKVIWIEAIPEVYEELKNNIASYPNQMAINACLGETDGEEKVFNVSNNESQSSSYLQLGTHKEAHPEVHYVRSFTTYTKTLKTILNKLGLEPTQEWLLVGDLQGAEMFMLKGAGELLDKFGGCYLEVNTKPVYEGCALKHEIEQYLAVRGFEPIAEFIYEHWGWGDQAFLKKSLINVA